MLELEMKDIEYEEKETEIFYQVVAKRDTTSSDGYKVGQGNSIKEFPSGSLDKASKFMENPTIQLKSDYWWEKRNTKNVLLNKEDFVLVKVTHTCITKHECEEVVFGEVS